MRYLVTGGAGFIGSAYVRRLLASSDHQVTVLDALTYAGSRERLAAFADDPRLTFAHGDVADPDDVAAVVADHQVVVHFAAETHVDRSILDATPFVRTNEQGTAVLCEAAARVGVERFIHVSTDEVYGPIVQGAFDEGAPLAPTSAYARSKARSDEIALEAGARLGLPVLVTRSTNQFGPWQFPEKLLPFFASQLLSGRAAPVYGDGLQVRDWLHVDDNCAWIDLLITRGEVGEVYNVAGHNERTNLQMSDLILGALDLDRSHLVFVEDRPDHDRRYAVATAKLDALGSVPPRAFEAAVEDTVRWYVDHRTWWEPLLPRVRNR